MVFNFLPRRVYRQQVDLDPHFLYYHSWQLGKVVMRLIQTFDLKEFQKHKKFREQTKRRISDTLIICLQGANWMVGRKPGETERGIESIDLEARCDMH